MPSGWNKVKAGDPVLGEFSASLYNTMIDMAEWFLKTQGPTQSGDIRQPTITYPQSIVLIQNTTGNALGTGDILGIKEDSYYSMGNTSEVAKAFDEPVLVGETPEFPGHIGSFVVLLDGVDANGIARGVMNGICPVLVDIDDITHRYADVTNSSTSKLTSREFGAAEILKKASSGTGDIWCLVRLGELHLPDIHVELTADLNASASATATVYEMGSSGGYSSTSRTVTVWGNYLDSGKSIASGSRVWARPQRTSGLLEALQSRSCAS